MPVVLTQDMLAAAMQADPARVGVWVAPLNAALQRFNLSDPMRAAGFLATIAVESGRLRFFEENLNYSADGLCRTWPSRFRMRRPSDPAGALRGADGMWIAETHARKPQMIANAAYGGRMGNGPPESGDGWTYRGQGPIQITGRANFESCGAGLKVPDLVTAPSKLAKDPAMGAASAGWFCAVRGFSGLADRGDIVGMRRLVNGGTIGLDDFRDLYRAARTALGIPI